MIGFCQKDGQGKETRVATLRFDSGPMIELPDFSPLRVTATLVAPTRSALDRLDHLLVVAQRGASIAPSRACRTANSSRALLARATKNGDDFASSRAANTSRHGPDGRHVQRRTRRSPL